MLNVCSPNEAEGVARSESEYLRALIYINRQVQRRCRSALRTSTHEPASWQHPVQSGVKKRQRETGTFYAVSLGLMNTSDADLFALKDTANIKLGYRYLQEGSLEQASVSHAASPCC